MLIRKLAIQLTFILLFSLTATTTTYAQKPSPDSKVSANSSPVTTPTRIATPTPQPTVSPLQATPSPQVIQLQPQRRDVLDYFLAAIQLLTIIGLALTVYKTWDIASATRQAAEATQTSAELSRAVLAEMKEARDEESAPYVVVYFDVFSDRDIMDLVVKNVGKSVAKNVKFEFTPPLVNSDGKSVSETSLVKNGIGSIPPGHEIRVLFDTPLYYFGSQENEEQLPLVYQVKVTYTGGISSGERTLESILDVSPYMGFSYFQQKGIHDAARALEKLTDPMGNIITKKLDSIVDVLKGGIWLKNTDFSGDGFSDVAEDWPKIAQAKLKEFKFIWSSIYGGNTRKLVNPLLNNLKINCLILSSQIIKIAAKAPSDAPSVVIVKMLDIASKLNELFLQRFYIDGGRSSGSFDNQGNEIVSLIDEAIKILCSTEIIDGNKPLADKLESETNAADSAVNTDKIDEEKNDVMN